MSVPAVPERLGLLRVPGGDPLLVLYGPGIDDAFVGHDFLERNIQQVLWEFLHAHGFGRIVFSSARRPLYVRDANSQAATRETAVAPPRGGTMRFLRDGPMGDRMVPGVAVEARPAAGRPRGGLSEPFALMMLDSFMRQPTGRTAVVLAQAEEQLLFAEARRTVAAMLAEWAEHGTAHGNLCVLIFRQATVEAVQRFVDERTQLPRLQTYLVDQPGRTGAGPVLVGPPDEAELLRLVQTVRLTTRPPLRIDDWSRLGDVTRAMAATGLRAREWQAHLGELARDGAALTGAELVRRTWLRAPLPDGRSVWDRLAELAGLAPVKEHLEDVRWAQVAAREQAARGITVRAEPASPHLIFAGNPGTGKTTVARLIGEAYRELGLLRRGHVVEVQAKDLIAGFVGQTALKTHEAVDRALDGVLFIDEAYQLSDQATERGFGREAISALLTRLENDRHRLVVVAAGYPEEMAAFRGSDPGLPRRFPDGNVIEFPDLGPDELAAVLFGELAARGLTWSPDWGRQARRILAGVHAARNPRTFGNAGQMREMAAELHRAWARRVRGAVGEPLTGADLAGYRRFLPASVPDAADLLADLDGLVGLAPVKQAITGLVNRLRLRQRRGADGFAPPHLLFVGPPGTGKTTVARLTGELMRALGLLRRGHVVEVTRAELIGRHLGDSTRLTREAVHRALDGVLFIDEAYSLLRDSDGRDVYGYEAIDTLTREMEHWRGRLVVVAAGYPGPMTGFLARNPGLRSRFDNPISFPGYDVAELVEILRRMTTATGLALSPAAADRAAGWLAAERRRTGDEFGNARTVRGLLGRMEERMGERTPPDGDPPTVFTGEDVPDAGH